MGKIVLLFSNARLQTKWGQEQDLSTLQITFMGVMNPQMQAEEVISRDSENLLLKFPVLESLCGATVQTTFCVRRKSPPTNWTHSGDSSVFGRLDGSVQTLKYTYAKSVRGTVGATNHEAFLNSL